MIIKKFSAKTENEAVELAKKELGENVVVMNVKNAKKKGFLSLFSKKMIEVTVAMEEESEKSEKSAPTINKAIGDNTPLTHSIFGQDIIYDEKTEIEEKLAGRLNGTNKNIEKRLDSLQSLLEKQLKKSDVDEEEDEVKSDEESVEKDDSNMEFMKLIYNTLIENEVAEKYANELIEEIEKINTPGSSMDFLLSNIYQKLILKFGTPVTIPVDTKQQRLIFFIGPTGVGKTTTIAKIASLLCVNDKKKVALFTTDTYRIAAAEQLRTYASILDAPFRVIYTEEDMQKAVDDFKDVEYILVDTAGHSHYNESQKDSMAHFLNCIDEDIQKDVYLVVSATTKYRDLLAITDAYSEFTDYKLIFTKLDETTTFGNLFNLCMHTGASMSYVTCGQNVPDDIEVFSPQSTVKQLLGGK